MHAGSQISSDQRELQAPLAPSNRFYTDDVATLSSYSSQGQTPRAIESRDTDVMLEINRRFEHSQVNRTYVFPRIQYQNSPRDDNCDSSFSSVDGVTIYSLHAQNMSNYQREYQEMYAAGGDWQQESKDQQTAKAIKASRQLQEEQDLIERERKLHLLRQQNAISKQIYFQFHLEKAKMIGEKQPGTSYVPECQQKKEPQPQQQLIRRLKTEGNDSRDKVRRNPSLKLDAVDQPSSSRCNPIRTEINEYNEEYDTQIFKNFEEAMQDGDEIEPSEVVDLIKMKMKTAAIVTQGNYHRCKSPKSEGDKSKTSGRVTQNYKQQLIEILQKASKSSDMSCNRSQHSASKPATIRLLKNELNNSSCSSGRQTTGGTQAKNLSTVSQKLRPTTSQGQALRSTYSSSNNNSNHTSAVINAVSMGSKPFRAPRQDGIMSTVNQNSKLVVGNAANYQAKTPASVLAINSYISAQGMQSRSTSTKQNTKSVGHAKSLSLHVQSQGIQERSPCFSSQKSNNAVVHPAAMTLVKQACGESPQHGKEKSSSTIASTDTGTLVSSLISTITKTRASNSAHQNNTQQHHLTGSSTVRNSSFLSSQQKINRLNQSSSQSVINNQLNIIVDAEDPARLRLCTLPSNQVTEPVAASFDRIDDFIPSRYLHTHDKIKKAGPQVNHSRQQTSYSKDRDTSSSHMCPASNSIQFAAHRGTSGNQSDQTDNFNSEILYSSSSTKINAQIERIREYLRVQQYPSQSMNKIPIHPKPAFISTARPITMPLGINQYHLHKGNSPPKITNRLTPKNNGLQELSKSNIPQELPSFNFLSKGVR